MVAFLVEAYPEEHQVDAWGGEGAWVVACAYLASGEAYPEVEDLAEDVLLEVVVDQYALEEVDGT